MAVELTGFSELIADLAGMAADLDNGPGVDRALQAGAVPIEEQMLANASSDPKIITGAQNGSIETFRQAVALLNKGLFDPSPLIEGVYNYQDFDKAMECAMRPDTYKVVIKITD